MNNLEKMIATGKAIWGNEWQTPLSRSMTVNGRTIRNFISGRSRIPVNLSERLLTVATKELANAATEYEMKIARIKSAIEFIESDTVNGESITTDVITEIVDRYNYADEHDRKCAIDDINNAIYEKTYLSDLDAIARKYRS